MSFEHGLTPGDTIKNDQLVGIFRCSPQGGMRKSNQTNTLLVVSNHLKSIYEDRWINDVLHYTGMGMTGDQSITFAQNRTLNESSSNGVDVFLFEVFEDKNYTYRGQVQLADSPYQEIQPDETGEDRNVWIFPVKIVGEGGKFTIPEEVLRKKQRIKEARAKRLKIDELERRAKVGGKSGTRTVSTQTYERNPYVSELAKRKANGICALCKQSAPFKNKKGKPYLETHHIVWLSEGGEDTVENTVALCPNCHRKMHILNARQDIDVLRIINQTID
ncbi:MAG: 5-methylcytosine-specific restriction protein A [Desulforhopalus sp.]